MSKEVPLKLIVGALSNEKGVSEEVVFQAIEAALVTATKKKHGAEMEVRVAVDRKTGKYETFRIWTIAEPLEGESELEFPDRQILLEEALKKYPAAKLG